jgi:RimJ/RimL family protein N-acetyltransferase
VSRDPLPHRTERLLLRRFRIGDKPALDGYRRHPEVARFQSWEADYPDEATARFLDEMTSAPFWRSGQWFQVAVEVPGHGLVGDVAVHAGHREARIGYSLHPDWWGQGIATEMVSAVLGLLPPEVRTVSATVDPENVRSRRLLERLGFTVVGQEEGEDLFRRSMTGANASANGQNST